MAGRSWLLIGVLSLAAICCWCQIHTDAQVYNYHYLEDDCRLNRSIELSDDSLSLYGFVRVTRTRYEHDMHCALTVWAPKYHHLTMRISRMDTRYCEDYLRIQQSNESDPLKYCGTSTPSYSISSLDQKLTYEFFSSSNPIVEDRIGFELHYTAFHRDGCDENEFRCEYEDRCIPAELTCDSIDNCGDWSDERSSMCGLSTVDFVTSAALNFGGLGNEYLWCGLILADLLLLY